MACGKFYTLETATADYDGDIYCSYRCANVDFEIEEKVRKRLRAQEQFIKEARKHAEQLTDAASQRAAEKNA